MQYILIQISLLFLLILLNGFFSMTEISVIASKQNVLRQLSESGNHKAKKALNMSENPNLLLSTVQIGITLIGLLAGALGGATLSVNLAGVLPNAWDYDLRYSIAFILVIISTTYFTIVIGELVPKRLGMHHPEKIAMAVAPIMGIISRVLRPLVHLLQSSTTFFAKLFRIQDQRVISVSEEEIRSIVEEGVRSGSIEQIEKILMHQILDLGDLKAADIMTPKSQLIWLDIEDSQEHNLELLLKERHSQYPVVQGGFETFLGIISERDFFKSIILDKEQTLEQLVYKPVYAAETMDSLSILDIFRSSGCREIMVVDEYGDIAGLITRKDVLEHIVGEMKEADEEPLLIPQKDGSTLASGMLPLTQLKKFIGYSILPFEEETDFHTLSGFAVSYFGYLPKVGETIDLPPYKLSVQEMDEGIRIKWMVIKKEHHEKNKEKQTTTQNTQNN